MDSLETLVDGVLANERAIDRANQYLVTAFIPVHAAILYVLARSFRARGIRRARCFSTNRAVF